MAKKPTLKTIEKNLVGERPLDPTIPPTEELRVLVTQHRALVRTSTRIALMISDRVRRTPGPKGEPVGSTMPCPLPKPVQERLSAELDEDFKVEKARLEREMTRVLKRVPIWSGWLSNVYGLGPVTGAYLIAFVDIHKAVKPSNLRRYCGLAVINGALERPTAGVKLAYNKDLRTALFLMFASMFRTAGKKSTTKYLDVWAGAKHRLLSSERVVNGKIEARGRKLSAKGFAHSFGWHKAADVFIEDLYIVWRALEGLPVWPNYYSAKLGYAHLGRPIETIGPQMLTFEEAKALVGDVGKRSPLAGMPLEGAGEEEGPELIAAE